MAALVSDIADIPAFAGIDREGLEYIAGQCVLHIFPPDQTIIEDGERTSEIYFVRRGIVAARAFATDGKEVCYTRFVAPQYFGEFSAIDLLPRSANIETLTEVVLVSLSSVRLHEIMHRFPSVAICLLHDSVAKNRKLTERVFEYSTLPVAARIRNELFRIARENTAIIQDNVPIELRPAPSHYEIAARTSTHREAVSRELSLLAADGVILTGRKAITIVKMARLAELVEQDRLRLQAG